MTHARKRRERYTPYYYIAPAVVFMLAMIMFPLVYSAYLMFTTWNLAGGTAGPQFVGLLNFEHITTDTRFLNSLEKTGMILAIAIPCELLLGLGLAFLLNRRIRARRLFTGLLMAPIIVAPVLVGQMFRMMMYQYPTGVLNYFFHWLPFYPQPYGFNFISDPNMTMWSVIGMDIWHWTPFMVLLSLAGLQSVPMEPQEAAMIDGANPFQNFRHITFHYIEGLLILGVVLRVFDVFKLFDEIYVLTYGGPGISSEVTALYLYIQAFQNFLVGYASALTYVILAIITVLSYLLIRLMQQRMKAGE